MRIAHMGDQRDARRPEIRIIRRTGNLRTKLRREFAMHGRAVHADLLEQPPVHHRHDAAAPGLAGVVGTIPRRADETSYVTGIERSGRVVFQLFKSRADIVAQLLEPGSRAGFAGLEQGGVHRIFLERLCHCEERKQRSNLISLVLDLDCFAALEMTSEGFNFRVRNRCSFRRNYRDVR